MVLAFRGQYVTGLALMHRALARAIELNDALDVSACSFRVGLVYFYGGDFLKALESVEATLNAAETLDMWVWVAVVLNLKAQCEARLGRDDHAFASLARYKDTLQNKLGGKIIIRELLAALEAGFLYDRGYVEEALALAETTARDASAGEDLFGGGEAERVWGQALAALYPPQFDEAETHLAASLQLLESGDIRLEAALTQIAWGKVCRDRGNIAAAREHFEKAAEQYRVSELPGELEKVQRLLDGLG